MSSFHPEKSSPLVPVDMINGKAVPAFQTSRTDKRDAIAAAVEPLSKKAKTADTNPTIQKVFTFTMGSCPVYVEVLSCHTLWDLVDIMFRECVPRGEGETAHSHLWILKVPGSSKLYESEDIPCKSKYRANRTQLQEIAANWSQGSKLLLEYDYGSTTRHILTVCGIRDLVNRSENISDFPRRQPEEFPPGPSSFQTNAINLNSCYPSLNQWAFESAKKSTQVNLFQAGRRRVHGYLERGDRMIFLPDKVCLLEHYLLCLERATLVEAPCDWYDWQSVIALPEGSKRLKKYSTDIFPNLCDRVVVPAPAVSSSMALKDVFPKVAALGGFRKDKKIKKGWIRYTNQVLMIIVGRGSPTEVPTASIGCAWEGKGCHVPGDKGEVLFRVQKKIGSVHELFCEVEGLLSKLCDDPAVS